MATSRKASLGSYRTGHTHAICGLERDFVFGMQTRRRGIDGGVKTVVCLCKYSVYWCLLCGAAVACVSACAQVSFESDFLEFCQRKRISRKSIHPPKLLEAVADESSADCIIVDGASGEERTAEQYQRRLKYKLLQFHENFRPAYWGTWRKRASTLSPRNPFKKDEVRKLSLGPLHLFT